MALLLKGVDMKCADCRKWLTVRVTDYENGERIVNFQAPDGKGLCEVLKIDTPGDFGCNQFEAGAEHIEIMAKKTGSPWHHSTRITCPDCKGEGVVGPLKDASCERCCRTGTCLIYDDGYLGEERTRRHPKEASDGPPPPLTCQGCTKVVEKEWVSCPWCGQKLKVEAPPMRVEEFTP